MKLNSGSSYKILEYAAQREKETRDFYIECLEKATIPGTRRLIEGLVADEKRHYNIVMKLLDEAKLGGDASEVKTFATEDAQIRITSAFPHEMADANFAAESATVGAMLKKALENEKESFDNYSKAAQDTEELEVKAIYQYLAAEENKHYDIISNIVAYLDAPGKWLYQEENLIFRL